MAKYGNSLYSSGHLVHKCNLCGKEYETCGNCVANSLIEEMTAEAKSRPMLLLGASPVAAECNHDSDDDRHHDPNHDDDSDLDGHGIQESLSEIVAVMNDNRISTLDAFTSLGNAVMHQSDIVTKTTDNVLSAVESSRMQIVDILNLILRGEDAFERLSEKIDALSSVIEQFRSDQPAKDQLAKDQSVVEQSANDQPANDQPTANPTTGDNCPSEQIMRLEAQVGRLADGLIATSSTNGKLRDKNIALRDQNRKDAVAIKELQTNLARESECTREWQDKYQSLREKADWQRGDCERLQSKHRKLSKELADARIEIKQLRAEISLAQERHLALETAAQMRNQDDYTKVLVANMQELLHRVNSMQTMVTGICLTNIADRGPRD